MQNFSYKVIEKIYYPKFQEPENFTIKEKILAFFPTEELALEYIDFKFKLLTKKDVELKFDFLIEKITETIAA